MVSLAGRSIEPPFVTTEAAPVLHCPIRALSHPDVYWLRLSVSLLSSSVGASHGVVCVLAMPAVSLPVPSRCCHQLVYAIESVFVCACRFTPHPIPSPYPICQLEQAMRLNVCGLCLSSHSHRAVPSVGLCD